MNHDNDMTDRESMAPIESDADDNSME